MLFKRAPPVNFVQLLLELRAEPHRLKLCQIAAIINVPYSTLGGWFYGGGSMPSFENGRALLQLHAELTRREKACADASNPGLQRSPGRGEG